MIRKSKKEDIIKVVAIYDKILAIEPLKKMIGWEKNVYPVAETANTALDGDELFVMEENSEVVASAIINHIQMEEYSNCKWQYAADDNEVMVLHTLVVDPEKSRNGYASKIISFYEAYAKKNACKYLRLDTSETNVNARKLYKKLGYHEVGVIACEFNGIGCVNLVCLEKKLDF